MGKGMFNKLTDPLDIFGNEKSRVAREDKLAAEAKADAKEAAAESDLNDRRKAAEARGRAASGAQAQKRIAARSHISRNQVQTGRSGTGLGSNLRSN